MARSPQGPWWSMTVRSARSSRAARAYFLRASWRFVASSRSERLNGLRRKLAGDLDNITLKALQKDPPRRYQSVADLANDIERHLEHLPIAARPNTLSYRASRFYQRNRIAVSAAAFAKACLSGKTSIFTSTSPKFYRCK